MGSSKRWTGIVCEDDALIRMLMVDALDAADLDIIETDSYQSTIDAIENREVDLLVTDIRLAGDLTGLDLAHWVNVNRPDVRILVVSGMPASIMDSSRPEHYTFLSKPFTSTTLLTAAKHLLDSDAALRSFH
ncbi:response regulator [uncultured Sphingomonas sp.]|uniref:response regulator n=1 Tax=uncultured Sphingomonas sp. TaxID=158754 RepID=UPI0025E12B11|nr:response regulator [uncultured Sphingomonas sp.]